MVASALRGHPELMTHLISRCFVRFTAGEQVVAGLGGGRCSRASAIRLAFREEAAEEEEEGGRYVTVGGIHAFNGLSIGPAKRGRVLFGRGLCSSLMMSRKWNAPRHIWREGAGQGQVWSQGLTRLCG